MSDLIRKHQIYLTSNKRVLFESTELVQVKYSISIRALSKGGTDLRCVPPKVYVCRVRTEIRVFRFGLCLSAERSSDYPTKKVCQLHVSKIPLLSYVIELPCSSLRSDCAVLFVHKTDMVLRV